MKQDNTFQYNTMFEWLSTYGSYLKRKLFFSKYLIATFFLLTAVMSSQVVASDPGTLARYFFVASSSSTAPTSVATGIGAGNLSLSAGGVQNGTAQGTSWSRPLPYAQGSSGWGASSAASGKYFTFTVEEDGAESFTLTELSFEERATGAGPSAMTVTINGVSVFETNVPDSDTRLHTIDLTTFGTQFTDIESAEVRIIGWANGSRGTSGAGQFRVNGIDITGTVDLGATPILTTDESSVSGLSYNVGEGPSDAQSFEVSGSSLDGSNVTISAPTNFEVSNTSAVSGFEPSVTLPSFDGAPETIWVRLIEGLPLDNYSDEITISGGGASGIFVAVDGEVSPEYNFSETFENYPETGSSYVSGSFTGVQGNTWNYVNARGNPTIDGPTVVLQNNATASLNTELDGGITALRFDYLQAFSTNVNLEVVINGDVVGTVTSDGEQSVVKDSGNIFISDVTGTFTLEFRQASGGGQVAIDNLRWAGEPAVEPDVATTGTGAITQTTAVLQGEITDTGGANVSERGFLISTTMGFNPETADEVSEAGSFSSGTYSLTATDLTEGTTYYFRAYAENEAGRSIGDELNFETAASATAPVVITGGVSEIEFDSAELAGEITDDGGEDVTERGFVYSSTVSTPLIGVSGVDNVTAGSGTGTFDSLIESLNPNTLYNYRAYGTNSVDTGYGDTETFITLPDAPVVGTGSDETTSSVTANWSAPVSEGNQTFTYTVQLSTDSEDFSSPVSVESEIASTETSFEFTGLNQNTEYFFRVQAENVTGSGEWSDVSDGITTLFDSISLTDNYFEDFSGFEDSETLPSGWILDATGSAVNALDFSPWENGGNTSTGVKFSTSEANVLGYQHTGTTGIFSATIILVNDTGETIENLEIGYRGKRARLGESRFPEWTVTVNGIEQEDLFFSSASESDQDLSVVLSGLDILEGETITIVWSSDRGEGSGASRQIGISNVSVSTSDAAIPTPVLSLAAGTYFEDQTVFVDNFASYGGDITLYYTLDGETPDSGDLEYNNSEGILLEDGNGSITLSVAAINETDESSPVAQRTYVFPVNFADIQSLREADTGSTLYRLANEAVFTAGTSFRNTKFFQDNSGFGIQIDDSPGVIETEYEAGDVIESGALIGRLGVFQGQIQFEPEFDTGEPVATGRVVSPVFRTLSSLSSDDQSRLVVIPNVEFEDGDGEATFGGGGSETSITDPSFSGFDGIFRVVFGDGDPNVSNSVIPEGNVTLKGIVQENNNGITISSRNLNDFNTDLIEIAEGDEITTQGDLRFDNLVVGTGATLTVGAGSSVTINSGGVLLNNGTVSGDVTFERLLTSPDFDDPDTFGGWVMLSPPVQGGQIAGENGLLNRVWTQGFPGADDPAASGSSPNVLLYNASENEYQAPPSNNFEAGRGYLAFLYKNKERDDDTTEVDFDVPFSLTGSENSFTGGEFAFPGLSFTGTEELESWNLLGNPFAAPLNWAAESSWTKNNIANFAYIYDPENDQYFATADGGEVPEVLTTPIIAPYQAFWVRASNSSPNLSVEEDARVLDNPNSELFSQEEVKQLTLRIEADGTSAATLIRFGEQYSKEFDMQQDGFFLAPLSGSFSYIYTLNDGISTMIKSLPDELSETLHIPVELGKIANYEIYSGEAVISWPVFEGIPQSWEILLQDNLSGAQVDLAKENEYAFTLEAASTSGKLTRDDLTVGNSPVMKSLSDTPRFTIIVNTESASSAPFDGDLPREIALNQNYPNPFNPTTQISYDLPESTDVRLDVFNVQGQRVATLVNSAQTPGSHSVSFDASRLSSGVYIYRLTAGSKVLTKKMMLIK